MSFNRLSYDKCSFKKSLLESEAPSKYMFYPGKFYHQKQCRIERGIVGGNQVSLSKNNLVDLESDLRGQTRLLSDCPSTKYHPKKDTLEMDVVNLSPCNMFDYHEVALPDKLPNYSCNQPY